MVQLLFKGTKHPPPSYISEPLQCFSGGGIEDLLVQPVVQHFGYFAFRPVFKGWFKSAHWGQSYCINLGCLCELQAQFADIGLEC
jgi:hypothetical protein